jgi:hypothetical protein
MNKKIYIHRKNRAGNGWRNMQAAVALCFAAAWGCGDEPIDFMKDFVGNRPPEVISFTSDLPESTEIVPNMKLSLSVEARDFEGGPLRCEFSSGCGSFRRLVESSTGCSIEFFLGENCVSSESIIVEAAVSDNKRGVTVTRLDLGDGRAMPVMEASGWAGTLSPGGNTSVNFSADGSGYYQFRVQKPPGGALLFEPSISSRIYERGSEVNLSIHAGSTSGDIRLGEEAGDYKVYIIFMDHFGRQCSVSQTIKVE